jgi:hypothetical protein
VRLSASGWFLVVLVSAGLGLTIGGCRRQPWVRVLMLFFAYNLALFLWLHVTTRYRIQLLPVACLGVGCLVAWIEAGCRPRPSKTRTAAAGLVLGLLMFFALA